MPSNQDQINQFKETARQFKRGDEESKFAAALKQIAKAKPPIEPEKKQAHWTARRTRFSGVVCQV